MAPVIATLDEKPVLALGTPGSYGICQTQTQALVNLFDGGMAPQAAIEAPRARLWDGRLVHAESRLADATIIALRARGHESRRSSRSPPRAAECRQSRSIQTLA